MRKEILEKKPEQPKDAEKIETTPTDDLWETMYDESDEAMKDVLKLLMNGMAIVETVESNGLESVIVKKKVDGSVIFQTTLPSEVAALKIFK